MEKQIKKKLNQVLSQSIQGNVKQAISLLQPIPDQKLNQKEQTFKKRFFKRFVEKEERFFLKEKDLFIRELIQIYQNYWQKMLLKILTIQAGEEELRQNLEALLIRFKFIQNRKYRLETLEQVIEKEIKKRNYFCITGTVLPYRELEIWRKQQTKTYQVELPEQTQQVKTIMMSDFISKGWSAYATMGRSFPGGWAKKNALYCNADSYNLASEKFSISYLTHEAQHFSDYKLFPKLGQIDLEYRAKLAELSKAKKTTKKLLKYFVAYAENNPKSPHAFSNFCLIQNLSQQVFKDETGFTPEKWTKIPATQINQIATTLLREHTKELLKKSPKRVKSLLKP